MNSNMRSVHNAKMNVELGDDTLYAGYIDKCNIMQCIVVCLLQLLEALDDDSEARQQRLANRFEEILPDIEEELTKC